MPDLNALLIFCFIALGMVMTPGPNMLYLISTSLSQGRKAGLISLGGVALGFATYLLLVAFGVSEMLFSVPYAFDVIRHAGAVYLFWLGFKLFRSAPALSRLSNDTQDSAANQRTTGAANALQGNGGSTGHFMPYNTGTLGTEPGTRSTSLELLSRGYITNLLNPKIALMYLSLLPQFVDPKRGAMLGQVLALGGTQIGISVTVNALIALSAGSASTFLIARPVWLRTQRMFMGGALMCVGLHLLFAH